MRAKYRGYGGDTTKTWRKLYGYKNLLAWQAADELAALVRKIVIGFDRRYSGLADQMLRAAVSAKSNIAEGYCRNALGDYIRFCEIARGSLGELGSQFQDCERWELVGGEPLETVLRTFGDATYFLEELIKSLRAKRKQGGWDRNLGVAEDQAEYHIDSPDDALILSEDFPPPATP